MIAQDQSTIPGHTFLLKAARLAPLARPAEPASRYAMIGCSRCGLVNGADAPSCRRCGAALNARKPDSLARTWALVIAGAVLYIPANYYPVLTVSQFGAGPARSSAASANSSLSLIHI